METTFQTILGNFGCIVTYFNLLIICFFHIFVLFRKFTEVQCVQLLKYYPLHNEEHGIGKSHIICSNKKIEKKTFYNSSLLPF